MSTREMSRETAAEWRDALLLQLRDMQIRGGLDRRTQMLVELAVWLNEVATDPLAATGHEARLPDTLGGANSSGRRVAVVEAGRVTGCSPRTITRLASRHAIAAERVGLRAWLVDLDDLQRHLRGKRHEPREDVA